MQGNGYEVLLTGATGYVGGLLLPLLEKQSVAVRCLARSPDKIRRSKETTQVVRGDVLDAASLERGVAGSSHGVLPRASDVRVEGLRTRRSAGGLNFAQAAKKAGVNRIIYLGGLGDDADPELSPHLRSRHEVGEILRQSGIETIEFRAGWCRSREPFVRSGEIVDRPTSGDDLSAVALYADTAHRRGRRAGLPVGGEGFTCG